ncbi:MAG: CpaF family protein [Lachnospiraceae bacterium]|nr:CpaF family protein [Lachnospiraceae bacterium]
MTDIKKRIRERVEEGLDMSHYLKDEEIRTLIDRCILEQTKEERISLKDKLEIRNELFNSLRRLDVLTEFLEDSEVSEVMLVGTGTIFIEKKGHIIATDRHFESAERLMSVIQRIVADCDRKVNEAEPIVDARLKDGSRVNVVLAPVSLDGPALTIRRFSDREPDLLELSRLGSFDKPMIKVFKALVMGKYNMLISGSTGSGKTTFLNALSGCIPKDERIITIEDSAELRIKGVKNLVRLETRNKSSSGENEITIRDLIKTSLRMRPDRIIVGEVRDAAAVDMLQAMNTGHDGSLSTAHANSEYDMLERLATMVLTGMDIPMEAIRKQIASAVDVVIHLGRLKDKSRRVLSISEVKGVKDNEIVLNTLYEFISQGEENGRIKGRITKINDMINIHKLESQGVLALYEEGERELEQL